MNRIYFRLARHVAKNPDSAAARPIRPIGDLPGLQALSHDCLNELETIMRAANDLDDHDH